MRYWFMINPSMKIGEEDNTFEGRCIDIMMGYLWYDIIVEVNSFQPEMETIGHHILGLVSHLSSRLSDNNAACFYR